MKKGIFFLLGMILLSCASSSMFKSAEGRFSVMFPGKPKQSNQQGTNEYGPFTIHSFTYEPEKKTDDNLKYEVHYVDYPNQFIDTLELEEVYSLFNGGQQSNLNDSSLTLIGPFNLDLHGHPGREYRWTETKNGDLFRVRLYLVGNREYIISVKTKKENSYNKSVNEFLNSFEISDTTRFTKYIAESKYVSKSFYTAEFPGKTESREMEIASSYGNAKMYFEMFQPKMVNDDNFAYSAGVIKFPVDITTTESFDLNTYFAESIEKILASHQATLISKKNIEQNGIKGIEFKENFKDGKITIVNRLFVLNDKQYIFTVMTIPQNDNNKEMLKFLNSFKLKP